MRFVLLFTSALFLAVSTGCGSSQDCLSGSIKCGSTCVNLQSDQLNCGSCGNACGVGQVCTGGECVAAGGCPTGLDSCSGTCRDLNADHANCGTCGHACDPGEVCSGGNCALTCEAGLDDCSGSCRDLDTDHANCGSCGHPCDPGEVCSGGNCALACEAGLDDCSGSCRDLQTDRANCGDCAHPCDPGEICTGGNCLLSCQDGLDNCDGTCRDLQSDPANCHDCGNACGVGETCVAAVCTVVCGEGLQVCYGRTCTDTRVDMYNCGDCGNPCDTAETCVDGQCITWTTGLTVAPYGLVSNVPAGKNPYTCDDSGTIHLYDPSGNTWSDETTGTTMPGPYAYLAWYGDKLWSLTGTEAMSYTTVTGEVATVALDLSVNVSDAQTTVDDAGNIYALADDGTIVQYDTTTGDVATFAGITNLPDSGQEPRIAWDSRSQKVLVADYEEEALYSLDPTDGTILRLADFPIADGVNDAFCSDRHGYLYTTDECGDNGLFYIYSIAANSWTASPLPFEVGCSGSCTVTDDGLLYLLGYTEMASLQVFTPPPP